MIIMLSKYICHCNTEFSVFQGFFLIFLYLVVLQGDSHVSSVSSAGEAVLFVAVLWKYSGILYILYSVILLECPFLGFLGAVCHKYSVPRLYKDCGWFFGSVCCFYVPGNCNIVAHNNHYVVWGTVTGCVGMRGRDTAHIQWKKG